MGKLSLLLILWSFTALSQTTANLKNGVILKGYDPVSYFNQEKPVKGKIEIKTDLAGVTYLFATEANKKLFLDNPTKFAPQYEGWCATAVAKGKKVDIDPQSYVVTDGRLFLFYNGIFADAKKDWLKDEANQKKKADANWQEVRKKAEE